MSPSRVSPPSSTEGLTAEQITSWNENGYLILPDALSPSEVQSLLSESRTLLETFPIESHPLTKFSTGETTAHVGDEYFLTSGDKIRFFFEEDAFSPVDGSLTRPKHLAINKIGHGLHMASPPFAEATLTTRHARIAKDLGLHDPRVLQSMVICKQPEIGGLVPPHQDSVFLYTDPPSAVGFWFALEDCTRENGCLAFAPGSHRRAPVKQRFVRGKDGQGTDFVANEGGEWPVGFTPELSREGESQEEEYVLGEVKAGSLVLIHGNILHKSEKNTSLKGRMIYTFHCIEGGQEHEYDGRNWLQPPETGFTKLNDALKQ